MLCTAELRPVHKGVIEPPESDNTSQCSPALTVSDESAATEQEVETG